MLTKRDQNLSFLFQVTAVAMMIEVDMEVVAEAATVEEAAMAAVEVCCE